MLSKATWPRGLVLLLWRSGASSPEDLLTLRKIGSYLQGHPLT